MASATGASSSRRRNTNLSSSEDDESIQSQTQSHIPELMEQGYIPIIDRIYREEKPRSEVVSKRKKGDFRAECARILASMPYEVISGLVNRDLAKRHADGDRVLAGLYGEHKLGVSAVAASFDTMQNTLSSNADNTTEWIDQSYKLAPAIYARVLIDWTTGEPPTPAEKLEIVRAMRLYVKDDPTYTDMIKKIDDKPSFTTRSSTAYLRGKENKIIENRPKVAMEFCDAVEYLCNQREPAPEAFPAWTYIGWSVKASERISQHDEGNSSFLMSLTGRIAEVLFPEKHFRIETFVVAYLAAPEENSIAEIMLTNLASAYANKGTGFAIHRPGINNSTPGLDKLSHAETEKIWKDCRDFRMDHTPYEENMLLIDRAIKSRTSEKEKNPMEAIQLRDDLLKKIACMEKEIESLGPEDTGVFAETYREMLEHHKARWEESVSILNSALKAKR